MTMIDSTTVQKHEADQAQQKHELETARLQINELTRRLEALKVDITGARETIDTHRQQVRRLYTAINQHITDNDYDIDDYISLASLDEIVSDSFTNQLTFTKVYEVQVSFTVDATIHIEARSEEEARSTAEEIGVYNIDLDTDSDVIEWAMDSSTVNYVGKDN